MFPCVCDSSALSRPEGFAIPKKNLPAARSY